jgi:hypothetical protein
LLNFLIFVKLKMSYPRFNNMSYPNENTYPQTRTGIYLGYNYVIPVEVNTPIQLGREYGCTGRAPSFSQAMLDGKIQMNQPGIISKTVR